MTDPAGASTRRMWWRSLPVLVAAATVVIAVGAELWARAAQGTPPAALLFLGRFHPLLVHLPIGVWVLVAIAEAAALSSGYRRRIDPVLGLALPVLLVFALSAFVLGQLLAEDGGYAGRALLLHRRLALAAVIGAALCVVAFSYQTATGSSNARWLYRGVLGVSLALLSVGAHFGGVLTHGDTYLTKYAPSLLRPFLGGEPAEGSAPPKRAAAPNVAEPLLFEHAVQPIFEKYCVSCHGSEKQKAELRLDSLAAIRNGGENGAVVVAGSARDSRLIEVLRLPLTDDAHMPPEGKPAPTAEERALLEFWIDRGANDTLRVRDLLVPAGARSVLEKVGGARPPVQQPTPTTRDDATPDAAESAAPAKEDAAAVREAPAQKAESRSEPEPRAAAGEPTPAFDQPAAPAVKSANALSILQDKCSKCHGARKQKGKLRVDSIAALLKGGADGPALVPGHPEKSAMIQRVRLPLAHEDHMPPKKEPQLDARELAILVAWVKHQPAAGKHSAPADAPSAAGAPEPEQPAAADQGAVPSVVETTPSSQEGLGMVAAEDAPVAEARLSSLPGSVRLYEDAIAPILESRCGKCHSGKAAEANLVVTSLPKLREGGWSGPGVVPGKLAESLVWQRVTLPPGDDDRMPPAGEPPLTRGELALLELWIEQGASAQTTAREAALPEPARRALARHYRRPQLAAKQSTRTQASAGGCAACTVGDSRTQSVAPFALAAAAALAFAARRLRGQPVRRYPS